MALHVWVAVICNARTATSNVCVPSIQNSIYLRGTLPKGLPKSICGLRAGLHIFPPSMLIVANSTKGKSKDHQSCTGEGPSDNFSSFLQVTATVACANPETFQVLLSSPTRLNIGTWARGKKTELRLIPKYFLCTRLLRESLGGEKFYCLFSTNLRRILSLREFVIRQVEWIQKCDSDLVSLDLRVKFPMRNFTYVPRYLFNLI